MAWLGLPSRHLRSFVVNLLYSMLILSDLGSKQVTLAIGRHGAKSLARIHVQPLDVLRSLSFS